MTDHEHSIEDYPFNEVLLRFEGIEMRILKIEQVLMKAFPGKFENSSQGIQLKKD